MLQLSGGRRVEIAVYGDDAGRPAILMHGFSDSRLTGRVFAQAAERTGTRLIVPDRPGTGGSTGRLDSLADVAGWLVELTDALGLERVPLVGLSGGGPFTLAAARFAPHRVERAVVVSGLGPPELGTAGMTAGQRVAVAVAGRLPGPSSYVLAGVAALGRRDPRRFLRLVGGRSGASDARAVLDERSVATIVQPFVEAYRQGPGGVARELRLLLRPWGFSPAEIAVPVRFEHGADDVIVPPAAARALARAVPHAALAIRRGVGHFTIVPRYADELLAAAAGVEVGAEPA